MATILQQINSNLLDPRQYSSKDSKVIGEYPITSKFNSNTDTVEFYIYDINKQLVSYTPEFTDYKIIDPSINQEGLSTINLDVEESISKRGFNIGTYQVVFNFFKNQLNSSFRNNFFIKEISSNRTELRISSNLLTNEELEEQVNQFITVNSQEDYFSDFIINFGENKQYIANNIILDKTDPNNFSVLIKLYSPLPLQFEQNDTLWIATEVADPRAFKIIFEEESITTSNAIPLRGPNYNISTKDQISNATDFKSINNLIDNQTQLTSSDNQLQNILSQKGVNINVNYTSFSNFCHFSSAEQRLENFYYKAGLIESASSQLSQSLNITSSYTSSTQYSSSKANLEFIISDTITNFDGYENYLYYTTGSDNLTWPKSTTAPIPRLYSTSSAQVLAWYGSVANQTGLIFSASLYDEENQDNLIYTIPEYLREDSSNAPFQLFIEMMGQYFDELYLYADDITNKHNADNRLDFGISKDLVGDVLKSFGIKLYENNFNSDDLYASLIGINASGSLNAPTGNEVIETYISASTDVIPLDDVNKETYKRIYHNMPYLLKKKGTVEGLKALINIFGIPDTILRVSEFGGRNTSGTNTNYDYYQNVFNYGYTGGNIATSFTANSAFGGDEPDGIFYRFKYIGTSLPSNGDSFSIANSTSTVLTSITYKGSSGQSGSFSGSIVSASEFSGEIAVGTARVSGSLFNGEWWNVGLSDRSAVEIFIGTQNNEKTDGFQAGYITSSIGNATLTTNGFILNSNSSKFAFQELKFFNSQFTDQGFKDLVMNPYKLVNDPSKDSKNSLYFRAPLGAELEIDRTAGATNYASMHPAITGSFITQSFSANSNYAFSTTITYLPQTQSVYYNQPFAGVKNRVSDKIRLRSYTIPNNTLSPFRSVIQDSEYGNGYNNPYGTDFNIAEIAFSPINEINDNIISTLPSFNIGSYIGDPDNLISSNTSYSALNTVRDNYFLKYYSAYEWRDYVRLIKYFNNSLFKMIQDFVPAKSSVTTGVVIKQHLLERNRYPIPQVTQSTVSHVEYLQSSSVRSNLQLTGTASIISPSGSEYSASAGTGGVFAVVTEQSSSITAESGSTYTQDVQIKVNGLNGPNNIDISSSKEFYNGELLVTSNTSRPSYLATQNYDDAILATNQVISSSMIEPIPVVTSNVTLTKGGASNGQTGLFLYQQIGLPGNATYEPYDLAEANIINLAGNFPSRVQKSAFMIKELGLGITKMYLGFVTGSDNLWTSSFDQLGYGDNFDFIFTEMSSSFPQQPTGIPYRFTIASIEKTDPVLYYTIYVQNEVGKASPYNVGGGASSYLFSANYANAPLSSNISFREEVDFKFTIPQYSLNNDGVLETIPNKNATILLNEANPLANSVNTNRTSYTYQTIEFGAGVITASNLPLIKEGYATRAQVQDSNYTKTGHINARYNGSRVSSPDFNIRSKIN